MTALNWNFYLKILRTYFNYKINRPTPAIITLRLSFRCNLKCYFCGLWRFPKVKELSLSQIKNIIDDMVELGIPYLNLTGGEPLLRSDIERIGEYSIKNGIFTTLNTHGTLITRTRAEQLVKNFNIIKVSLDGLEKTHDDIRGVKGTFKKVNVGIKNLLRVKNRKAKIILHLVANRKNIHEIPTFLERYNHMVDSVTIMPEFDMKEHNIFSNSKFIETWKEMDKIYNLQESHYIITKPSFKIGRKYCDAAKLYYSVLPEGQVICCSNYPVFLGDINEESFYEIWKKDLTKEQKEKIDKCKGCFCRSTTEISMLMRKSPFELLLNAPKLIKKYKF